MLRTSPKPFHRLILKSSVCSFLILKNNNNNKIPNHLSWVYSSEQFCCCCCLLFFWTSYSCSKDSIAEVCCSSPIWSKLEREGGELPLFMIGYGSIKKKKIDLPRFGEERWIKCSLNTRAFFFFFFLMSVQKGCIYIWLCRPVSWPSNYFIWNSTEGIINLEVASPLLYHKLKLPVCWGESGGRMFITAQVTACQ